MMEIKEAIEELRKGRKRKFVQSVDLIVNLKNFDVRKEALNTFVNVPHPTEKKVAAFLTKKSKVVDTITEGDFSKYNDIRDIKKLAKRYDAFISIAPLMSKIATKFGRVFGPLGKMPSPQAGIVTSENDDAIELMVKKVGSVIRVRNKEMAIKLIAGKENMSDSDLEENVNFLIKELEGKLPRGRDNVKNILLKFTMSSPVKILEEKYGK